MSLSFSFDWLSARIRRSRRGVYLDQMDLVFDKEGKLPALTLVNPTGQFTLTYSTESGRGAARVYAPGTFAAGTRVYAAWANHFGDGTYRYLTQLRGTAPSSTTRRGQLPFARANFDSAGVLQNGYLTGPRVASGVTNRYNLLKAVAGVETQIIAEDSNRAGTYNTWRWDEFRVLGSSIAHRTYLEGTVEASIPAWQEIADTEIAQGDTKLHGIGYQKGAADNSLHIAEMHFIAAPPSEMTNTITSNLATYKGDVLPASNVIINNKAVYY